MIEGNTDEIKMEINSCFVRKHEYWERRHGKNWIARITGLDKKYGYRREFLQTVTIGTEKVFRLEDFHIGEIYEIASISAGGNGHVKIKDAFECMEITETHVILKYLTQDEVIEILGEENKDVIAQSLVQQLLKIVTKDQALKLIQYY